MRVKQNLSVARFVLGTHTVHWHMANFLEKLKISSRATVVARAAHWTPEPETTNPK